MNKYEITVPVESEHGPGHTLELFSLAIAELPAGVTAGNLRLAGVPEAARQYRVEDNVTGAHVSRLFPVWRHAASICREMNVPGAGGRYIVCDQDGNRVNEDPDEAAINHDTVREQTGEDA